MPKMIDPFEIQDGLKPYRMTYQWVRQSTMGTPDADHLRRSKVAGWRKVKRTRHKALKASALWDVDTRWIEYGGLALMERPTYLCNAARKAELDEASAMYSGWCEQVGRRELRPWYAPASVKQKANLIWNMVKWLPQVEFRRVIPRLTYPFKKQ